jgi:hypothetical protein
MAFIAGAGISAMSPLRSRVLRNKLDGRVLVVRGFHCRLSSGFGGVAVQGHAAEVGGRRSNQGTVAVSLRR